MYFNLINLSGFESLVSFWKLDAQELYYLVRENYISKKKLSGKITERKKKWNNLILG